MTILLAGVPMTGVAHASTGSAGTAPAEFPAQARALGLDGSEAEILQDKADAYLAERGGTQVAADRILLDDGAVLLLALPGEERPRALTAPGSAAATCPYTYVCAFEEPWFSGDGLLLFHCDRLTGIPWSGTGSWINNQRAELRAEFYDFEQIVRWTSPGGYSEDPEADWSWVWYLSPC